MASGDVSYPDISRHSLSGRRKSALAEVVTQHDTEDEPVPEVEQEPEPEAEPETLEDLWNFFKEVGSLNFLDCRTPLDVI